MSELGRNTVVAALRAGFTDSQIAQAFDVTQSAVSQFIDAHGLREEAAQGSKFRELDDQYNKLEKIALDKLERSLQLAVLDPLSITRVLGVLNGAKRRSLAEGAGVVNNNTTRIVNIQLPEHVRVRAVLNAQSEVVEIDGRTIATIDSGKIDNMAKLTRENKDVATATLAQIL